MTQPIPHALVLRTIQHVSPDRLQRAVCGLADGSFTATLTRHTATEIRALVKNGDGVEYGVVLTETMTTCSCKDSLYRAVVCKHAVALALQVLRTPQDRKAPEQEPQPVQARCIHLTRSCTPSGPRLCGAQEYRTPAWVIPFVPETPWPGVTCLDRWALYQRPARATTATA